MTQVFVARHPTEAHLVQGLLESNGIVAEVRGESLFALRGEAPATSDTLPTVWVLDDGDATKARDVLAEFGSRHAGVAADDEAWPCPSPGVTRGLLAPLAVSAALVAPFIALQWINRRVFQEEFPVVLFTFMAVHSLLMVLALTPAVHRLRVQRSIGSLTHWHWAGLVCGAALAYTYVTVVADQLPCFLGVPNCD